MSDYFKVELKNARNKTAEFFVEELKVKSSGITFDSISMILDGAVYEGNITTFAGRNLNESDIFEQVINSYLRDDTSAYEGFGEEWKVFDTIKDTRQVENGVVVHLPYLDFGDTEYYELDLATSGYRFYHNCDEFVMYDNEGGLITDYESFYLSGVVDELKDVHEGKTECLYINDDFKEWVESEDAKYLFDEAV